MTTARTWQPGRPAHLHRVRSPDRMAGRPVSSRPRPAGSARPVSPWAVVSAGLAPVLLIGAWAIAGPLQPASYSPVRQTVSVLAGHAGAGRWIMTTALLLVGGCHLVTAAGLTGIRARARITLMVAGLASIGIAASPEPVHGSSHEHLAWTMVAAAAITLWPAFAARSAPARPLILSVRVAAAATAVLVVLLGWLIIETQRGDVLGLAERLTTAAQTTWPFIIALALQRTTPRAGRPEPAPQTTGPD
jgi:hypothetical protein